MTVIWNPPAAPVKRSSCPDCGPSLGWERPTAATLALILAMHVLNTSGSCESPRWWVRVWDRAVAPVRLVLDVAWARTALLFSPLVVGAVVLAARIGSPSAWLLAMIPAALAVLSCSILQD